VRMSGISVDRDDIGASKGARRASKDAPGDVAYG